MQRFLFFLLSFLISFGLLTSSLFAQNVKNIQGPPPTKSDPRVWSFLGQDASNYYCHGIGNDIKSNTLLAYSKSDLRLVKQIPINLGDYQPKGQISTLFMGGGTENFSIETFRWKSIFKDKQFHIVVYDFDKKANTGDVYLLQMGLDGKVTKAVKAYTIESGKQGKAMPITLINQDSTKFMIYYSESASAGDAEKIGVLSLDLDGKASWSKKLALPFKDRNFIIETVLADGKDNIFILGQGYLKNSQRSGGENWKYYHLLGAGASSASFMQYEVRLTGKDVRTANATISSEGALKLVGFYGQNKENKTVGVYHLTIDPQTLKSTDEKLSSLENLYSDGGQDKSMKNWQKSCDYELSALYPRPNGGIFMLGQQVSSYSVQGGGGGSPHSTVEIPLIGHIMGVYVDASGNVEKSTRIPYSSQTPNSQIRSLYNPASDNVLLVFSELPENYTSDGDKLKTIKTYKDLVPTYVLFKPSGTEGKMKSSIGSSALPNDSFFGMYYNFKVSPNAYLFGKPEGMTLRMNYLRFE